MASTVIERFATQGVVLLDGGMGQELRRLAPNSETSLWSAQALLDQPALVQSVHKSYIRAGARVITTNSYATVRSRLAAINDMGHEFERVIDLSGRLARAARDEFDEDILIAGCLPPLNGSYRPDRVLDFATTRGHYQEHVELLSGYVDIFLCETMSTAAEGRAAAEAAACSGKPVWLAWTLKDTGPPLLRSGESLQTAWDAVADLPIQAVLCNCCAAESITLAMPQLQAMGLPLFGGYANGFSAIPDNWTVSDSGIGALGRRDDLDPSQYAAICQQWIDAGATVIGGCCEITPAHIARLHELLGGK